MLEPSSWEATFFSTYYQSYHCSVAEIGVAATWYGRAFVHAYYGISPTLVKWFGDTAWFNMLFKSRLDAFVKYLQEKGYEATPYADRDWQ